MSTPNDSIGTAARGPIVTFESRHPSSDAALVALSSANLSAISKGEAHEVYLKVLRAAEDGSAFAMCLCATWPYVHGQDKVPDAERHHWANRAAQSGYPPGLCELAVCFERGIGVPRDLHRAVELYRQSEAGGFGLAAYRLGIGYKEGRFGPVDVAAAVQLMERAYEQGEPLGALDLGRWFESGEGVPQNPAAAVRWYEHASEMGNFFATHRLQMAYALGQLGLPRDPKRAAQYESTFDAQTTIPSGSADQNSRPDQKPNR